MKIRMTAKPIKIAIALLAATAATAATAAAQDGTSAYNFLNITSSSRIYGLGGVNITTVEEELSTTDQNPALLGPEMTNQVQVDYMRYLGDSNFAGARYTHSAGERGAWAVGVRFFGYGSMKETDAEGNILGTFSPKDLNFNASFSYDITDRLRGGVTLKVLNSSYEQYSAFALATDLGLNYYDVSLSLVVANLGGLLNKFNDRTHGLPIDLRLGITKGFTGIPLRVSITAWNLTKWHLPFYETGDGTSSEEFKVKDSFTSNLFRHLVFGLDFTPSERFYIALGYNYKTRTDMSTYSRSFLSGFSLGAGLNLDRFSLGLAFAQPHSGATTLMVNLNLNLQDILN